MLREERSQAGSNHRNAPAIVTVHPARDWLLASLPPSLQKLQQRQRLFTGQLLGTGETGSFFPKWSIFLAERDDLGGSLFIKPRLSKRKKRRALTAPAHRDQYEHIERTWIARIRAACERFLRSRGLKKKTVRK